MRNLLQGPGIKPVQRLAVPAASREGAENSSDRIPRILYYGLLAAFVLEYLRPGTYVPPINALKINTLVPLSVFVFTALYCRKMNSALLKETNAKWLLFFLFLILVSILTADVTYYAWFRFKQILGYYIFFFIIFKAVDDMDRMKGLFLIFILIHIALAFLNPKLILNPETRHYIENVTFLGDGNDFALSVCITIPFAILLIQESNGLMKKVFFALCLIVLITCIIGTSSRGASLALAGIMFYQWLKSRKKIIGIALLGVLGIAVLAYAPTMYFDRMETITDYENEGSAKGRLMAWGSAIRMAAENPVLGVGAGHFPVKYGTDYRPPNVGRTELPWSTAHSIYFLILGELGLPGIVFLLSVILSNFFRNERRMKLLPRDATDQLTQRRILICLNSSLIAFAIAGAFLSAVYYPHLYVIAGIFTAFGFHPAFAPQIQTGKRDEQD